MFDIAWSPDGKLLATATNEGLHVYDDQLREILQLPAHDDYVMTVAWKPDGTQLASGGSVGNHAIWIWDYDVEKTTFEHVHTINTDSTLIAVLEWSPDGLTLASFTNSNSGLTRRSDILGELFFWDSQSFQAIGQVGWVDAPNNSIAWSPDSTQVIISGRDVIATVSVNDEVETWSFPNQFVAPSVSWSVSDKVIFRDAVAWALTLVDGKSGEVLKHIEFEAIPQFAFWHPTKDLLLIDDIDNDVFYLNIVDLDGTKLLIFPVTISK